MALMNVMTAFRTLRRWGRHAVAASAVVPALALCACSPKEQKPTVKPPVPVVLAKVERKTIPVQIKAIGNVEPYATVAVKAQVSGEVVNVHFTEGQDVKKGDLLFAIDPRTYAAALKKAEANLSRNLVQARNARQDAERYAQLLTEGIVTQEQYEQYRTKAEAFAADVAADRAAVENAKVELSYCTIRSPLSGRTGNLAVHAGNIVKANENPPLVTINQITPVYVTFAIPEKDLAEIKHRLASGRLAVEAIIPNDQGPAEQGTISFLDNAVDAATGTIKLKGIFENKGRRLWPGQFVNVVVTLASRADAVVVPSQALQTGQSGPYLFVVKADTSVEVRPVTPGITHEGLTVIEQGVAPGETVVTDGQMRLTPNAKVTEKRPGGAGVSPPEPSKRP
ncbi:efflux RND transporter periplasmic adaptor subunit [Geobacter sulfurreducens]|jgi:multidrug efflux system membrane fusion protein|uniref:Efflux pump, RND family, membrane fusion lipoprotein n=1 Tax=Geobacter sulfurreducens (strain ATCC 51573 / DSM 12127 / PCA) TaxID=243231 RepID=Q74CR2_GEOSL|nr:efflux RND transporter periplasmic adaptor subunit [Geobacter sulfurreducens]AAR34984.1 efflux pump, RND family, membrane fusion lipoprotein [Geobacter sulfurreducens PCA]ADI84444.1 efflux pump, RND family, membrane fusion lipoprotein [Geobacter sulfurreducens KN400]AJY71509.1 RND transporter [Geobacter sulfurreducens]QVW36774.1 efflux RND transporter periplasmic adaptor subunit [Geobacter sulfurreducens]UAC05611.1 efflux RND transporter periplasmic adaptor subunit [Geobacter sulfurreducens